LAITRGMRWWAGSVPSVPAALQIGGFQGNSSYNLMVESLNTVMSEKPHMR